MRPDRRRDGATEAPLRRGTDRIEDAVAWILMSLGMVLLIMAGVLGLAVHGQERERSVMEAAARTEVGAFLVEDAPIMIGHYGPALPIVRAGAAWTAPDGTPRNGRIPAPAGSPAGTQMTVWVDRDGDAVAPPRTEANAVAAGSVSAVGVVLAGGAVLGACWVAVRCATAARNARRWESEWAQVEPQWSRYLH